MSKIQQWVAATAVLVLAILVAGWFLAVSPERAKVSDLNSQAAAAQTQVSDLKSKVDLLIQQKKTLPEEQKKIAAFAKQIPADASLPTLVRQLTAAAKSSGVSVQSIQPGAPTPLAASTSATATAPAAGGAAAPSSTGVTAGSSGGSGGSLMTVPVQLQVNGDYFQLEQYVSALEQLQRRFLVTGYTLDGDQSGASSSTSGSAAATGPLTLNLTGSAFDAPGFSVAATTTPGATGATGTAN